MTDRTGSTADGCRPPATRRWWTGCGLALVLGLSATGCAGGGSAPPADGTASPSTSTTTRGRPTTSVPSTPPGTSSAVWPVAAQPSPTGSATALAGQTGCGPDLLGGGSAAAVLSWEPAAEPGPQKVQVSIAPRPFDDTAAPDGALAPGAATLRITDLAGQATHLWRVLTLHGEMWIPSEPASFEGPLCGEAMPPG
jgi:hypothetical protein